MSTSDILSTVYYSDSVYCTLCDAYFVDDEARKAHVQFSPNHPLCRPCNRRFINMNYLRTHLVCSPRHHYCSCCEKEFETEAGLRVHIEFAAVHRDDDDDDDDEPVEGMNQWDYPGWEEDMARVIYPDGIPEAADDDFDVTSNPTLDEPEEVDIGDWGDELWGEDEEEEASSYTAFAPVPQNIRPSGLVMRRDLDYSSSDTIRGVSVPHPNDLAAIAQAAANAAADEEKGEDRAPVAFICPVCRESPKDCSATRCGHIFCTPCITEALKWKEQCPVCRKIAVRLHLRKLYLTASAST